MLLLALAGVAVPMRCMLKACVLVWLVFQALMLLSSRACTACAMTGRRVRKPVHLFRQQLVRGCGTLSSSTHAWKALPPAWCMLLPGRLRWGRPEHVGCSSSCWLQRHAWLLGCLLAASPRRVLASVTPLLWHIAVAVTRCLCTVLSPVVQLD